MLLSSLLMTMVGLVMMIELILGILGFGESHNNLTGSNAVSREYNISTNNFAIIKTDISICMNTKLSPQNTIFPHKLFPNGEPHRVG